MLEFKNVQADQRYRIQYSEKETNLETLPSQKSERVSTQPTFTDYLQTLTFSNLKSKISNDPDVQLAYLMEQADVRPPSNPTPPSQEMVKLGEALFWDPELSGNRDMACATCHHPDLGTGDNLSVSIGTNGFGLGEERDRGTPQELVPRNATPLYNLGYEEWDVLFWDACTRANSHYGS